jgi:trehalose 6-phosphate phosphatase
MDASGFFHPKAAPRHDGQDARVDISTLVTALRPDLEQALVAVDFDGTLAPIVADPAASRPAPGAVAALRTIANRGAQVAVITGRDARTVVGLGGLDAIPGVIVEGLYGAERWHGGVLTTLPEPEAMRRLRAELPAVVATGDPKLWIEDKRLSLVVHGRKAADPEAALDPVRESVTALGERLGLFVHPGRGVLELRLAGYDKGTALRRLAAELSPKAVLFVGDDVGDLPAFAAVDELREQGTPAWSVAAVSPETPEVARAADVRVDGPAGVVALLQSLR